MTDYNIKESTLITFTDEFGEVERRLCPECRNHKQGDTDQFHDCKNLFYDGFDDEGFYKIVGQCCCYAKEHGIRKRRSIW